MSSFFMSARRFGLAFVLAAAAAVGAQGAVTAASPVTITLSCYGHPERTTIRNNTALSITVKRVGSTYQPYSYEPVLVNRLLGPGKSITFQSGYAAAGANKLTGSYIYNDNGQDGAKVITTVGIYTKHC